MSISGLHASAEEDGRELAWMLRAIRKHMGKIILIVVLACLGMTVFVLNRTKEYTAYTEILIGPGTTDFGNLEEDDQDQSNGVEPADLESEIRLIHSANVARSVMNKLDLDFSARSPSLVESVSGWFGVATARSTENGDGELMGVKQLNAFRKRLSIERDPLAYVVSVGYRSKNRHEAAEVANAIANAYLDDRLQSKRKALSETAESLGRSVEELADWLKTQEREIETFRADSDLYAVNGVSPAEQRYNTLTAQLTQARLSLTEAQSRLSQADEAVREGKALGSIREVQVSPVVAALRGQETGVQRNIADLATRFGKNHPIMTNAKAELADIRSSVRREIDRIVEQLQLEVTVAQKRFETVETQLADAQSELSGSKSSRIRLKELERDVEAPRRVYETMLERYQRAREQEKLLIDTARIIGPAQIPEKPSNISGMLLLGFTAAGSCAAGFGLAFLLELFRPGYQNALEAERDLGHRVLGLIPTVSKEGEGSNGRLKILEAYGLTEAIRGLVYAILPKADRDDRNAAKVLVITSSFPNEGKSTVALSLARQAATSGLKTLLIEGDLRKPGMRQGMTKVECEVGLVDILKGEVHYADDAITTEADSGVDIMLGFGPVEDAFSLMRGERMEQLLEAVRPRYDLVIIDAAPIMAVSETRTLVDLADETLFIVRWKITERTAARAALRDLERMDATIVGVVLTQVNLREHLRYEDADRLAYQDKYSQYATSSAADAAVSGR